MMLTSCNYAFIPLKTYLLLNFKRESLIVAQLLQHLRGADNLATMSGISYPCR